MVRERERNNESMQISKSVSKVEQSKAEQNEARQSNVKQGKVKVNVKQRQSKFKVKLSKLK